jgi:hypothetical protein
MVSAAFPYCLLGGKSLGTEARTNSLTAWRQKAIEKSKNMSVYKSCGVRSFRDVSGEKVRQLLSLC